MQPEENKAVVRRVLEEGQHVEDLLEACNAHDTGRITTFYAPDYEGVDVGVAEPYGRTPAIHRPLSRALNVPGSRERGKGQSR